MIDYKKVFIIYNSKDRALIQPVIDSLSTILDPCISEDVNRAGEPLTTKIRQDIESSNVIVPFLTNNSMSSPWVNQELGYAFRWQLDNDGEPLILPVCKESLQPSGFLTKKDIEMIPLLARDIDETTYRLIKRLREYIDRNFVVIEKVKVTCGNCKTPFDIDIPKQEVIDEAVKEKGFIPANHQGCSMENLLDPRTLTVARHQRMIDPKNIGIVTSHKVGSFSGSPNYQAL